MGELGEFSLVVRSFLRTYKWRRIDPVPWASLERRLAECRLGLVSSAGLVLPDQEPFDDSILGGDVSFREIPSDVDATTLSDTHASRSFDHSGMRRDPNLAFPIDRVRELVAECRIGSAAPRHLSFQGRITAPGRLVRKTAPWAAERFVDQRVDIALLVPV